MNTIPTQELFHQNEKVFFACRTMEANHERTGGKPDVPHRHDFYTIIFVKEAVGKHFIDYVEFPLTGGMVFLLSPGQVHQIVSQGIPHGDIIMFSDEFLSLNFVSPEFISNLGLFSCGTSIPPLTINSEGMERLSLFSGEIKKAFESDQAFRFDVIASYLKLFLIECNRFAISSSNDNPQLMESGRSLIRLFKELLEKNFARWHTVKAYANQLNITPDYLNNVLKTNIGKNAKELIVNRIVLEAKRLGLHTSYTSKEIAFMLGFDDPLHFSKFFKKESGQSFSDFRSSLHIKTT